MAVDSFSHSSSNALDELDPLSRALIDLSVKRGMSDAEIGEVLGTDADAVFENRVALLRSLAEQIAPEAVDADLPELEAAVAERLYGDTDGAAAAEPIAPVGHEPATTEGKRRSPLAVLLPLLVLVALVAGFVLLTSGGDDEDPQPQQQAQTPDRPAGDDGAEPQRTRLTSLGGRARGTATIDGDTLRLRVRGLPAGTHEVWLYDSVIDARSIGRLSKNGTLSTKLPRNARDYEYLDVSSEPADGNPNHSGQSLLRVPVAKLSR